MFVTNAYAQCAPATGAAGAAGGPGMSDLLMFAAIFAIFYFVLILPQRKQQKAHETMLKELKRDDKVLLTSGIFGIVDAVKDTNVVVRISDNVKVTVLKTAISGKADPDAPKTTAAVNAPGPLVK